MIVNISSALLIILPEIAFAALQSGVEHMIRSKRTGKCLTYKGENYALSRCTGLDKTKFLIQGTSPFFRILSKIGSKDLTDNGVNVTATFNESNQEWNITLEAYPYYIIKSEPSGLYLSCVGMKAFLGTRLCRRWEFIAPNETNDCKLLPYRKNGTFSPPDDPANHGAVKHLSCDPGYVLADPNFDTITCNNAVWTGGNKARCVKECAQFERRPGYTLTAPDKTFPGPMSTKECARKCLRDPDCVSIYATTGACMLSYSGIQDASAYSSDGASAEGSVYEKI